MGSPTGANGVRPVGRAEAMVALFFIRFPQIVNLWEEEETQPLHLLQGNLIMDCRFRRSRAVSFLRSICRTRVQRYCFFFIPTRRHKKVAYLPKSRNCVNTAQTPLQKNANIFIFFATPSGLSSFFAFWRLSFSSMVFSAALLCRLFRFTHGLLSRQQTVFVFFPFPVVRLAV